MFHKCLLIELTTTSWTLYSILVIVLIIFTVINCIFINIIIVLLLLTTFIELLIILRLWCLIIIIVLIWIGRFLRIIHVIVRIHIFIVWLVLNASRRYYIRLLIQYLVGTSDLSHWLFALSICRIIFTCLTFFLLLLFGQRYSVSWQNYIIDLFDVAYFLAWLKSFSKVIVLILRATSNIKILCWYTWLRSIWPWNIPIFLVLLVWEI